MFDKQTILDKLQVNDFEPFIWAQKGIQQTLFSYFLPYNPFLSHHNLIKVPLSDGDKIVIALNTPIKLTPPKRIALLIHGLSGSYLSKYMIRMTQRLTQLGYLVVRMNLRGTGPGKDYAKKLYHGGMSSDVSSVLTHLAQHYPTLPVTVIGFSLGANIALKLAGESQLSHGNMDSLVAVSAPMDLYACVQLLSKPPNKFLDKHFAKELVTEVTAMHTYLNLPLPDFPKALSVYEFDEIYTAPQNGFASAMDYYSQSSALQYLQAIKIPTFILCAKNDPLIFIRRYKQIPHKEYFDVLLTDNGGHVGWISNMNKNGMRWMDEVIAKWIGWMETQ